MSPCVFYMAHNYHLPTTKTEHQPRYYHQNRDIYFNINGGGSFNDPYCSIAFMIEGIMRKET